MSDQDTLSGENTPDPDVEDRLATLEKRLADSQEMISRQGNEIGNYRDVLAQMQEREQELIAATQRSDPQQDASQWREMHDNDPVGTMALLNQQQNAAALAQFEEKVIKPLRDAQTQGVVMDAAREMRDKYSDWDELRGRVGEEIGTNILFNDDRLWSDPVTAVAAYDQAYAIVKGRDAINGVDTTPQQDAARAMKLAAQTVTGGGSRPDAPDAEAESWARIAGATGGSYADLHRPR